MAAGFADPVKGYMIFCAVKFAGYSFAAFLISDTYGRKDRNALMVGAARTLIGMVGGGIAIGLWFGLPRNTSDSRELSFMLLLLPLRILEWWLLIWMFYDRKFLHVRRGWKCVSACVVGSYILDIPATLGFFGFAHFFLC